jgi:hypothetical protein
MRKLFVNLLVIIAGMLASLTQAEENLAFHVLTQENFDSFVA